MKESLINFKTLIIVMVVFIFSSKIEEEYTKYKYKNYLKNKIIVLNGDIIKLHNNVKYLKSTFEILKIKNDTIIKKQYQKLYLIYNRKLNQLDNYQLYLENEVDNYYVTVTYDDIIFKYRCICLIIAIIIYYYMFNNTTIKNSDE